MNFNTISELLNTSTNMTQIRNTTNSTTTDTVAGVGWFKYKGIVCNNIYIDRNNYLGFGANANHLGVCYRTGSQVMAIFRQEGTLGINEVKFLKFRIEASTRSGYTTSTYTLTYEVFLLETQDIFLNVIKTPTSSSYIGVSTFDVISLSIPINSTPQISMYADSRGIVYELLVLPTYAIRYLIKSGNIFYRERDGVLTDLGTIELNSASFLTHGSPSLPAGPIIKQLANPKIMCWQASDAHALPRIQALVSAIPPDQYLYFDVDMSDATIKGISHVTTTFTGSPKVSFSKDACATWEHYDGSAWVSGEMYVYNAPTLLTTTVMSTWIGALKNFKIRIKLSELDTLKDFKVHFKN